MDEDDYSEGIELMFLQNFGNCKKTLGPKALKYLSRTMKFFNEKFILTMVSVCNESAKGTLTPNVVVDVMDKEGPSGFVDDTCREYATEYEEGGVLMDSDSSSNSDDDHHHRDRKKRRVVYETDDEIRSSDEKAEDEIGAIDIDKFLEDHDVKIYLAVAELVNDLFNQVQKEIDGDVEEIDGDGDEIDNETADGTGACWMCWLSGRKSPQQTLSSSEYEDAQSQLPESEGEEGSTQDDDESQERNEKKNVKELIDHYENLK